jgi:pimeloyl-ACP methyl ester carboxylesterase
VDANRIVLIGHSLGAFAALTIATEDLQIRAVGALALFDLGVVARIIRGDAAGAEAMRRFFEWTMPPLHGTSPEELIKETLANGDGWFLPKRAFLLADRSLLFVTASRDTIAPGVQHTQPLLAALQASTARDAWCTAKHVELDSDHSFSDRRVALARTVLEWVKRQR